MSAENNKIGLIVAIDQKGGIGAKGGMPWNDPAELRHFRWVTMGRVLIMGSRTVDSLIDRKDFEDKVFTPQDQEVLKGRQIIVVSRKEHVREYVRLGLYVERSLEDAIAKAKELTHPDGLHAFLAGGGQLYKEALEKDLIDTMLVSVMRGEYACDTQFPEIDPVQWDHHTPLAAETFTVNLYSKRKDLNEPALYSS